MSKRYSSAVPSMLVAELTGFDSAGVTTRFRAVSTALVLAVVGSVTGLVTLVLLLNLLTAGGIAVRDSIVLQYGLTVVALQGIGFAVTVGAFLTLRDRWDLLHNRVRVPTLREFGVVLVGIVGLLATLAGVQVLYNVLGLSTPQVGIVEDGLQNPQLMLYMLPLSYLLIGPGEELLFRGMVQGLLREAYASIPAIIIASAIFALAHVTNVIGAPLSQKAAYLGAIFVLSLLLGGLYEYTENLVVVSLIHGTYNALLFLAIYAQGVGVGV